MHSHGIVFCGLPGSGSTHPTESGFDPDPKQGSVPVRLLHPTDGIVRYSTGPCISLSVFVSVVDPDPHGSALTAGNRI